MNTLPGFHTVPGWERFPWLRAAFSTRSGGRSAAYGAGDQNLGWTPEDDRGTVAENRRRFLESVAGQSPAALVTAQQVHGSEVLDLAQQAGSLMDSAGRALLCADGLVDAQPHRFVGVVTADCVPVLVADTRHRVVGAFHAGWRGTLAGIATQGIDTMRRQYGSEPADLIAAVGPAIRSCCFAVGTEVRDLFQQRFSASGELFGERQPARAGAPQLFMDLQEANRRQLTGAGVAAEAVTVIAECTACTKLADGRRRYFSYRAERGVTGRMLNVIGVVAGRD